MAILSRQQLQAFHEDGFLIVEDFIDPADCARAAARFEKIFAGEFDTGVSPDGINFGQGVSAELHNQQVDNAWKCDYTIAGLWMTEKVGEALTQVIGGPGAMVGQDITIWKKPGAQSVYFHQDSSYSGGFVPGFVFSCAIALSETSADVGTIEYVRGSHRWELAPPREGGDFYAVDDYFYGGGDYRKAVFDAAGKQGVELTEDMFVKINAAPGTVVLHHSHVWHGSGPNVSETEERMVVVGQCSTSDTVYAEQPGHDPVSQLFRRYKMHGSNIPHENFHPILWREDGYRTPWLDDYIARASA